MLINGQCEFIRKKSSQTGLFVCSVLGFWGVLLVISEESCRHDALGTTTFLILTLLIHYLLSGCIREVLQWSVLDKIVVSISISAFHYGIKCFLIKSNGNVCKHFGGQESNLLCS